MSIRLSYSNAGVPSRLSYVFSQKVVSLAFESRGLDIVRNWFLLGSWVTSHVPKFCSPTLGRLSQLKYIFTSFRLLLLVTELASNEHCSIWRLLWYGKKFCIVRVSSSALMMNTRPKISCLLVFSWSLKSAFIRT